MSEPGEAQTRSRLYERGRSPRTAGRVREYRRRPTPSSSIQLGALAEAADGARLPVRMLR